LPRRVFHFQEIISPLIKFLAGRFPLSYFCAILTATLLKIAGVVVFLRTNFTILLFVKVAGNFSKNETVSKKLSALSSYSFWIYAAHAPFVVTAFLCTTFLMIFGFLLKKFLPGIFTFTTGERKKISLPLRATTTTRKSGQEA